MTQRSFTGIIVLGALLAAILYLWQPWNTSGLPTLKLGLDLQGGLRVVLQSDDPNPLPDDLDTARRVIENRVNQFGVSEPVIQTSGGNRIIVELPGLTADEIERARELIGQQAVLEFRLVEAGATDPLTLDELEPAAFTGEILQGAQASFGQFGESVVGFQVQREWADDFGRFTGGNTGRRMAIVLDENIISAPVINSRIDSEGQITGNFTLEEASDLSLVLRSGSLPLDLHLEEERAIGPTLGQDSIRAGITAALIGGAAVVVAVVLFYGPLFGLVLTVAVLYALALIFGVLAGLGAALTLPGLAGLVLTIGAAVDGNVISFERVKEELRAGRSLRLALKYGHENSLSAIIDANVTTLFAAIALYQYTTGPVRGFAITLAIGIAAAVFANIVVVPFLLDVLTVRFKRPLMPRGFYASGLRFIQRAPVVMTFSGLIALAALALVLLRPFNLSTDFTGGTGVLLSVPPETTVNDVRGAIDGLDIEGVSGSGATVQEVEDATLEGQEISVRIGLTGDDEVSQQFAAGLAEAVEGTVLQTEFVGPSVGADLRQGAVYAILVAFGLILVYVGWRFWPNWIVPIAAIVASVHDVGIVLGVLNLAGIEFSIPVLAALLFVVGYSLNDSIIIADRIRENLRKMRDRSYAEIVDISINQTLSRTVMTSGTTLLPVIALLLFGGSVLQGFSLTLLIGIIFGTYSSVFIVGPLVVWFKNRQRQGRRQRRTA